MKRCIFTCFGRSFLQNFAYRTHFVELQTAKLPKIFRPKQVCTLTIIRSLVCHRQYYDFVTYFVQGPLLLSMARSCLLVMCHGDEYSFAVIIIILFGREGFPLHMM